MFFHLKKYKNGSPNHLQHTTLHTKSHERKSRHSKSGPELPFFNVSLLCSNTISDNKLVPAFDVGKDQADVRCVYLVIFNPKSNREIFFLDIINIYYHISSNLYMY